MDEKNLLAEKFETNRGRLRSVAYRMLGTVSEAEDAVQEAWLRLSRADADGIDNLNGWLTTVVARVCLDMLRARTARREEPMEVDVPELAVTAEQGNRPGAGHAYGRHGRSCAPCRARPPGAGRAAGVRAA